MRDVSLPRWRTYFEAEGVVPPFAMGIMFDLIPPGESVLMLESDKAHWRLSPIFKVI